MSYEHFRSERELRAGVLLWQIFSPLLLLFGTIGNTLSIMIMSKKKFRTQSSTHYLIALAAADMTFLYVGLPRQWVIYTFGKDFRQMSNALCKVHWLLMYSSADMPVWILVTITVERVVATVLPHRSKIICTPKVAKIVLMLMPLVILVINSHLLYGFGRREINIDNQTMIISCAPITPEYEQFLEEVWTWIDLCKYSLIPFAILSGGNICIIWKVCVSRRRSRNRIVPTQNSAAPTTKSKTSTMTVLLICLNVVFITCSAPICVYFIGEPYWIPSDITRNIQLQDPWWALVNILMYSNSALNFVLYCLSGSKFREELKKMFVCNKRNNNLPNGDEHTTA